MISYYLVRLKRKRKNEKKGGWSHHFLFKKKKKLALIEREGTLAAIQLPRNGGNSSIQTCVQSTVQHSTKKV